MPKRLYKVYHLPDYNDEGRDTISKVEGLGSIVVFKPIPGKKKFYFRGSYDFKKYKVYSHEKNIELTFDDVLLSKWVFDEEKQHILLQEVIRKEIKESNLTSEPLPKEDFQEYVDNLDPLPDNVLLKIHNEVELTREEGFLLTDIYGNRPRRNGWTDEEIVESDEILKEKIGLNKYPSIEKQKRKEKADKLKRILLVLFFLFCVGGGSFSIVQLQNGRSRTGKVTSSVSPTVNPTEVTAFPSGIQTEEPTEVTLLPSETPTPQPTQAPTEEPTQLFLLPSMTPTQQPTQTPTEKITQLTLLPSIAPTQQPTQTPTEKITQLTLLPSKSPTKQLSNHPSPAPSSRPTNNPTLSPILSPTQSPSLQQKSRMSCEEIRKSEGATEGNLGKNNFEIEIIKGNKYCGDTYGGKDPERPNRNKWSVRSGRRDCPTFSFEEGFNICESVGARWCSVEELELLVGKGTGCGGDEQLIYSNSDCESESGLKGKIKFAPGSQAGKFPSYKCEIDLSSKSLVRCCGDV